MQGCFQVDANSATHMQMRHFSLLPFSICISLLSQNGFLTELNIYSRLMLNTKILVPMGSIPHYTYKASLLQPRGTSCHHFPHLSIQFPICPLDTYQNPPAARLTSSFLRLFNSLVRICRTHSLPSPVLNARVVVVSKTDIVPDL